MEFCPWWLSFREVPFFLDMIKWVILPDLSQIPVMLIVFLFTTTLDCCATSSLRNTKTLVTRISMPMNTAMTREVM